MVLKFELRHIAEKETEVAFLTKPTYKVLLIYRDTVNTMRIAFSLLDKGAGVTLLQPSCICIV